MDNKVTSQGFVQQFGKAIQMLLDWIEFREIQAHKIYALSQVSSNE